MEGWSMLCSHIMYKGIQPFSCGLSKKLPETGRNIILCNDPSSLGIVHIMMNIGNLIRKAGLPGPSKVDGWTAGTVIQDSVSCLPGKIQSVSILLQYFHHADALTVVGKALRMNGIKCGLS